MSVDGAYFDALMEIEEPTPVAHELLLIEGGASHQSDDQQRLRPPEMIWAVAELGAERALLPPAWMDQSGSELSTLERVEWLNSRLDDEFALIDQNVAELFEAIRIGSIEPEEADRFVAQLRTLIENSRERMEERLRQGSESGTLSVAEMIESFGSERIGTELSSMGLSLPDPSSADAIPVAPKDEQGSLAFRRLSSSAFGRYASLRDRLSARLSELEESGLFDQRDPQKRPSIMEERIRSLRRELSENPSEAALVVWRDAVDTYFDSIAALIDEETEARLLGRLGSLERENPEGESARQLRQMRVELAETFAAARGDYAAVMALRDELAEKIGGSFVIIGDGAEPGEEAPGQHVAWPFGTAPTLAERRATVANAVLMDTYLLAPVGWYRALLLAAAGLLVVIALFPFRLGAAILLSPAVLIVTAGVFPLLFLVADIWVDPIALLGVLVGAVVVSLVGSLISQLSVERTLTGLAAHRLPPPLLRRTFLRGRLPATATRRRRAAVVVLSPEAMPDTAEPSSRRQAVREPESFHKEIAGRIKRLGGIVIGEEGTVVFAIFGALAAPTAKGEVPEDEREAADPRVAHDAWDAVEELVSSTLRKGASVRCGVDVGELTFYLSPIGGYRATGAPMTYARRLCALAQKHRRRALFGQGAVAGGDSGAGARFREEGKLVLPGTNDRYPFFSSTRIDPQSP